MNKIHAIYCDGHCKNKLMSKGYSRIVCNNGNQLKYDYDDLTIVKLNTPKGILDVVEVYSPDTPNQQINYAEITALYMALRYSIDNNIKMIYIGSKTSNAWSCGRISKKIKDKNKLEICQKATKLRKIFEQNNGIIKIVSGKDNLADFGYHN